MVVFLAALTTALAALGGVWLTNKHNRRLKLIELREQTALTIRQEKREVYLQLLRSYRTLAQYAVQIGHMSLEQQLRVDVDALDAVSEESQRLIPELELVASRPIYDLSQRLYAASSRCSDTMYHESERRFAGFERDNPGREPSREEKEAIWEEVRAEVQKVYEQQGIEQLYGQLRNQVREELGFLALDPGLVPTPEETARLRRELANLDQLPTESGRTRNPARGAEPPGKAPGEATLRASRLELVDGAGEIRALLDTRQGGHVSLSFFGGEGQELVTVGVMPDGFSTLILNDGEGRESVKATGGGEHSDTVVVLKDGDERTRLQLGVSDAGEPALALADEDGGVRVQTYLSAEGSAVMTLKDGDGGANVSVLVGSGDAAVVVADETDTGRVGMLAQAGDATLAVMDGEGTPKVVFRVGPDGQPTVSVEERDGP